MRPRRDLRPLREAAAWACQAAQITPPPGPAQVLDDGCVKVTIAPGEIYAFDGRPILEQQNIEQPACTGFRLAFTWQVTSSGPLPVGLLLHARVRREGTHRRRRLRRGRRVLRDGAQ